VPPAMAKRPPPARPAPRLRCAQTSCAASRQPAAHVPSPPPPPPTRARIPK